MCVGMLQRRRSAVCAFMCVCICIHSTLCKRDTKHEAYVLDGSPPQYGGLSMPHTIVAYIVQSSRLTTTTTTTTERFLCFVFRHHRRLCRRSAPPRHCNGFVHKHNVAARRAVPSVRLDRVSTRILFHLAQQKTIRCRSVYKLASSNVWFVIVFQVMCVCVIGIRSSLPTVVTHIRKTMC